MHKNGSAFAAVLITGGIVAGIALFASGNIFGMMIAGPVGFLCIFVGVGMLAAKRTRRDLYRLAGRRRPYRRRR